MAKIRKINVWSLAKFQTILLAMLGMLAGIVYSFGGLLIDTLISLNWMTTDETPGLSYGTILAFGALLGMPLIFAGMGFILGIIEALLYNLYTKMFGWFEINFDGE